MKNLLAHLTPSSEQSELQKLIAEWEKSSEGKIHLSKANLLVRTLQDKIAPLNLDVEITIAGGYFRDLLLGRYPKDMDVWLKVRSEDQMDFEVLDANIITFGAQPNNDPVEGLPEGQAAFEHVTESNKDQYEKFLGNDPAFTTYDTYMWWRKDGIVRDQWINLLPLWQPMSERVVDRFDYGICQVWWTPEHGIQYTEAFENDFTKKELTCLVESPDPMRTSKMERVLNIKKPKKKTLPAGQTVTVKHLNDLFMQATEEAPEPRV